MKDDLQQFRKQQEISEGLFGNLLSKTKKIPQPKAKADKDFQQASNGTFVFGNKSTAKQVNTPGELPFIKEFGEKVGWRNSKLNFIFLPGTEFHADRIDFNLKEQTIESFNGVWKSGPFIGGFFKGTFMGSSFQGKFSGPFTNYESHPTTFVDGLFYDTTKKGLLGMPNTITLDRAKNRKFNLITVPVGYYLQFRSVNGITGYIKVLKRLDYTDSTFQFEVLDGFSGQKIAKNISLPWTYFRQNWKFLEINPKNPRNFGGLIIVPDGDYIKEMYISTAPATFTTPDASEKTSGEPEQFDANQQHAFSLSKLPYLGITSIKDAEGIESSDVNLKFDSEQEFEQFNRINSYINSGMLAQDIKNIKKAIKYKEVDGYGPFVYLKNVFDNMPGKNIFSLLKKGLAEAGSGTLGGPKFTLPGNINNPIAGNYGSYSGTYGKRRGKGPKPVSYSMPVTSGGVDKEQFGTIPSMQRLNDFIRYFVENITLPDGNPNEMAQNEIVSKLKGVLGVESLKPAGTSQSSGTQGPGIKGTDIPGAELTESIRNTVRGIINDSF